MRGHMPVTATSRFLSPQVEDETKGRGKEAFCPPDEEEVFVDKRRANSGRNRLPRDVESAMALRIEH